MNATKMIADLDASLARRGEDIILERGSASVQVRARVGIKDKPNELVSGTKQDDLQAIMSMTQIRNQNWPSTGITGTGNYAKDTQIPRRGDVCIVKGRRHLIEACNAIAIESVVVRVELLIAGNASGI